MGIDVYTRQEDVVIENLEIMMKKKFFTNAYIDRKSNCIVIANKQAAQNNTAAPNAFANEHSAPANTEAAAVEMAAVKCNSCGGINTIQKGAVGECDYCGSAIKAE